MVDQTSLEQTCWRPEEINLDLFMGRFFKFELLFSTSNGLEQNSHRLAFQFGLTTVVVIRFLLIKPYSVGKKKKKSRTNFVEQSLYKLNRKRKKLSIEKLSLLGYTSLRKLNWYYQQAIGLIGG